MTSERRAVVGVVGPDDFSTSAGRITHASFGDDGRLLVEVEVFDDDLWAEIRSGGVTGFSIGGQARLYKHRPWWRRWGRWLATWFWVRVVMARLWWKRRKKCR